MIPWDTYDSTPPRGTELPWTRVYRRGGREAHLRREDGSGIIACVTERPDPGGPQWNGTEDWWHGTGSQAEYDHAAEMPLCTRCFSVREAARTGISEDQGDPEERGRAAP